MIVSRPSAGPAGAEPAPAQPARTGLVVPFAPPAVRRRRAGDAAETRGEILLFLGVRYERRAS
ncbi:hypothetical protein [uncultured Methylobacterium sp.]|uniref:hypothetical protein n=1 Tax=uncultured Methylobacterium sp. TaxID=157278 RepID=UPI0035CABCDB